MRSRNVVHQIFTWQECENSLVEASLEELNEREQWKSRSLDRSVEVGRSPFGNVPHCSSSNNSEIEEPSEVEGKEPTQRIINMELPPATLKTLVNDLSRIREQLSNIARK
ncbi:hypothetical protein PV327_004168 [Microctonus hyperodae]|uniref:Uncharacterized protein n=1 Tax=Microctonus hyperodae TaxID=165561 RepID=A0AA39KME3_MICHY|nr:hypothetical protein PV327_004168 [Microctonus hyperodae]